MLDVKPKAFCPKRDHREPFTDYLAAADSLNQRKFISLRAEMKHGAGLVFLKGGHFRC